MKNYLVSKRFYNSRMEKEEKQRSGKIYNEHCGEYYHIDKLR